VKNEALEELQRYEGCLCRIGSPRGPDGTSEKVYLGRGKNSQEFRARVIMIEKSNVRHVPFIEIYPR